MKRSPSECAEGWVKLIMFVRDLAPDKWQIGIRREDEEEIVWGEAIWPTREAAIAHTRAVNGDFEKQGLAVEIPTGGAQ